VTADPFEDELDEILREVLEGSEDETAAVAVDSSSEGSTPYLDTLGRFTRGSEAWGAARTDRARAYMDGLAAHLDLDAQTVDMGEQIFSQFAGETDLTGHVIEFVAAAALYCSCKINEVPVTPQTFAEAADDPVSVKYLLRRSKMIVTTVGLDPSAFFDATHYVSGYCVELNTTDAVEQRAIEILEACRGTHVESGKAPTALAAAAIYNASRELGSGLNQSEIASVADVSTVTIRNRYQDQHRQLKQSEPTPADPVACIWWLHDRIEAPGGAFFAAADLLATVHDETIHLTEGGDAVNWALGALRAVTTYQWETLGVRSLSRFTAEVGDSLADCSKQLSQQTQGENAVYSELRDPDTGVYQIADRGVAPHELRSTRARIRSELADWLPTVDTDEPYGRRLDEETPLSDEDITAGFPTATVALASLAYHREFESVTEVVRQQ
jgi:transcription initiation factor TFIIB